MEHRIAGIIPAHNHGRFIADSINGMVDQTRQIDMLAIVDNGSKDDTRKVVTDLIEEKNININAEGTLSCTGFIRGVFTWFVSVHKPLGPSAARNIGCRFFEQNADIYAFCDSDDFYAPEKVERSLKYFEDPNVSMVYSDFISLNNDTGISFIEYKEPFDLRRLHQECLANSDSLIRKEHLQKVGWFPEHLRVSEDYATWIKLGRISVLCHLPAPLVTIRTGSHSSTATVSKETWQQCWNQMRKELQ